MRLQRWLLEAFVLILTFAVCWQVLTVPPSCFSACVLVTGSNCDGYVNAEDVEGPYCFGPFTCYPIPTGSGTGLHYIDDACWACIIGEGIQHHSISFNDSDGDGTYDTVCKAYHFCCAGL